METVKGVEEAPLHLRVKFCVEYQELRRQTTGEGGP